MKASEARTQLYNLPGGVERGETIVMARHGRAHLVVQDAASYQDLLDRLAKAETVAAIRRGLADSEQGRLTTLRDAGERLRSKHGR
ncbi:MAG: prevent-host-death family protein [Candidatus Solibacter sp.]|nr:prevent-host-death family protein [Candidatus Solibacter sp.]